MKIIAKIQNSSKGLPDGVTVLIFNALLLSFTLTTLAVVNDPERHFSYENYLTFKNLVIWLIPLFMAVTTAIIILLSIKNKINYNQGIINYISIVIIGLFDIIIGLYFYYWIVYPPIMYPKIDAGVFGLFGFLVGWSITMIGICGIYSRLKYS